MKLKFTLFLIFVWGINISYSQTSGEGVDFLYAKRLFNDSMFDLAAKQFHDFAEKYPENPKTLDALKLAGDSYFMLNRYEDARKEYTYLILRFPNAKNADEAQFNIGKCFREQGMYSEAANAFLQVKVLYRKSKLAEEAFVEAGQMFARGKQFDSAIEVFFDFLEEYPKSLYFFEAQLDLAKTFIEKGELNRALAEIEKILGMTKKGNIRAQSLVLQGEVEENLGKVEKAEAIYLSVISGYGAQKSKYKSVLAQTNLKLAALYRKKGQYAESNKFLLDDEINILDENTLVLVSKMRGDNYLCLEQYSKALEQYQAIENLDDTLDLALTYKIGKTYEKLENFQSAVEVFKKIIDRCETTTSSLNTGYCKCSYLSIAESYQKMRQIPVAVRFLGKYAVIFPNSKYIYKVRYKIAKIYETELLEYEHALRLYYEYIAIFPDSRLVDDAQLSVARCYESLQNYDQAAKEYQKYLKLYPGAERYDEVEKRIDCLNKFFIKGEAGALNKFASLIGDVIDAPDQNNLTYKLALTYFNELKDYSTAVSLLRKSYNNTEPKDEILYYLAKAFKNLAEKEFYERGTRSANLDSAQSNYSRLLDNHPQSKWCDEAAIELIKTMLLQTDDLEQKNSILKESLPLFIYNYPTSPYLDYAHFHSGNVFLHEGINNVKDSLNAAEQFQKVIAEFPKSRYAGTAQFNIAKIALASGDKVKAIELFSQYIQQFPQDRGVVQAHFILANLFDENGDYENVLFYFNKVINNYFYSPFADSANIRISKIFLETKDYSGGINHFLELEQQEELPCDLISSEGTDFENEVIYRLGMFYQKYGKKKQAISYYQKYLKQFPTASHVPDVLFFLSELFNTNFAADIEMALNFLKRLLNDYPQSRWSYQANIYAGDLLMKKEEFSEARKHYLDAVSKTTTENEKLYPTMQVIICLYKSDLVAKGDQEKKQFKKSYKDIDDYLGQIELAKGDYYFDRKFFETAEECYKSTKSDFKKTDYGPKAELALGKLYLVLNKDEDALKILTKMPKQYADNKIVPDAYLALGEFYYLKARQVENAMVSFKSAVEHPRIEERSLIRAMSYLIKCYFDLRLWERALSTSRDYLERFPLAKNAFDVRIQIGYIYHKLNEYDRAISYLKKLKYEADRESEPRIQFQIADSYWEKGQFEMAITEYLRIKYISKPTKLDWAVTAQYKAGLAYMKLGKMDEARMIFKKIVAERGVESNFGRGAQKKIDEIEQLSN